MLVKELIEKLMEVENKDLEITFGDSDLNQCYYEEVYIETFVSIDENKKETPVCVKATLLNKKEESTIKIPEIK